MTGVGHFRSDAARRHFASAYEAAMAALPERRTLDVPTAFGEARVHRFGDGAGRPVVMLPGRNASTPMWAANLPGLLSHRTVYCVDLIGEPGLSVQRRPITDARDQARWLDDVLAGLRLDSAHLLGVSFGGWSATNLAVRHPRRVASLTLLDPVLTFAPIPVRTMLAVLPMSVPHAPEWLRRSVLRWIAGGADVDGSDPVARLVDAGSIDYVLRQPHPTRFTADELRGIDVPVLALFAGRSVIHDARRAAGAARETLRHGHVELWDDASHAINGEFPERIADRARRFWDEVDG
ncbi:alpha/beta fold hydrolase [Mycolicibacterium sediminis]|uniref:Carboxylesterase n=1 Tax=Mycolicibacterium sediminis TaxID=1286180 RepID=A0A7I7QR16_9MYCO|nr:alpha/beta hydrolase [Mycolicibacterium sediminis]BBY28387.1 carboxylesterase [Mycolicibacterium sediminis]